MQGPDQCHRRPRNGRSGSCQAAHPPLHWRRRTCGTCAHLRPWGQHYGDSASLICSLQLEQQYVAVVTIAEAAAALGAHPAMQAGPFLLVDGCPPRSPAAAAACLGRWDRLLYTLVCLAIFLVCSQLPLYGVKTTSGAGARRLHVVTARGCLGAAPRWCARSGKQCGHHACWASVRIAHQHKPSLPAPLIYLSPPAWLAASWARRPSVLGARHHGVQPRHRYGAGHWPHRHSGCVLQPGRRAAAVEFVIHKFACPGLLCWSGCQPASRVWQRG